MSKKLLNLLTVHPSSPEAIAVARYDRPILTTGYVALSGIVENGTTATLNCSVEPPVLELRHAEVTVTFGEVEKSGNFKPWESMTPRQAFISGDYRGPDSQLTIFSSASPASRPLEASL